jgi:hypothetical protein
MEQSLWGVEHLENWQPSNAFNGESPGYFLVLQSILAHDADFSMVRRKVLQGAEEAGYRFPHVIDG